MSSFSEFIDDKNDQKSTKEMDKSLIFSLIVLFLYIIIVLLFVPLRYDHLLVILAYSSLLLMKKYQFTKDLSPFLLVWLFYDGMAFIIDDVSQRIQGQQIYDLEVLLFGKFFDGEAPPVWFYEHEQILLVTAIAGIFYLAYVVVPIVLAIFLWFRKENPIYYQLYWELALTFLFVSVISIITFYLFPVAPPWYYVDNGYSFSIPQTEVHANSGQLSAIDDFLGFQVFTLFYSFESNPFAAFPSLHVSYPILSALIWKGIKPKRSYLMWLFPLGVAFSAVYLNHHWFIDVLAGLIYTLISYKMAQLVVKRVVSS